MSERPKDGVDPDATVMMPRGRSDEEPDPDATVMVPAARVDDDATVMLPSQRVDDDATVMIPARNVDDDATVMIPGGSHVEGPDPDATIAIPTPGRRRDAVPLDLPPAPPEGRASAAPDLGALGGLNTLVAAANPVLAVVPQIRHALRHPDPEGLRATLRESLVAFERDARAAGHAEDVVSAAGFALCALLDESASSTPWGASWASQGLLAERHPASVGGEYFFELLERLSADPAPNLAGLEFLHKLQV